jgi:alpha-glucosidase (family GH31 glycosyl hydrolase)
VGVETQSDKDAARFEMQYMLGKALLVKPVCSDTRIQSIYLPHRPGSATVGLDGRSDNKWINFWTGELVATGQEVR